MKFIRLALAAILSFSLSAYADGDEPSGEGASESSTLPRPDPEVAEFARGVKFTVEGYEGGTEVQKNFPVLVRLAEYDETTQAGIKGFRYDDFYNDGSADTDGDGVPNLETIDICFLDAETNAIPYDIDTWDTSGESLVWVNLPKMTNGTEFVMWYRSSKTGKFLNPTNAWTEYAGVWHFNEYYGDETGSVKVYDSTTNNLTGDTRYSAYTKGSSYEAGMIGRARKMGDNIGSDNKDTGGVRVPLGASDSVARKAVDALTPEFSASFWYRQENGRYEYLIGRKATDNTQSWGIQHNADQNNIMKNIRIWSSGNNVRAEVSGIHPSGVTAAFNTWYKLDVVWTADSKYQVYVNGVNTKNGDLNPKSVAVNGDVDLYLGGGGSGCRVLCGEMDEVRLRYGKPTAARVKADYQTVTKADFLTAGEVKTVAVVERPVVSFSITDYGASYVQFAGTLSSLGDANATSCTARYKIWRASGEEQPAEWATFASELGANATFSGIVKTLSPETVYSYKLEVVNDEDVESDVTSGTLTTSGAAVYGTGGTITRVGDDWLHTFRLTTVTNQYEFVAPSYATSVKVLAVAGGGPGGYRAGGGGGAGGLIYNAALAVSSANTYVVTVGEGGAASEDIAQYGENGGNTSITNITTGAELLTAIGGGAGGNGVDNASANFRVGVAGGSGGGSTHKDNAAGLGRDGQGNAGGVGNSGWLAGGGGGAVSVGDDAATIGNNQNAGNGGGGFECDISGANVYYAGGGGGGGCIYTAGPGMPGSGGNGGGGTGSRPSSAGVSSAATQGVDGLGGGGGGGNGDNANYYKGGDGGDGIVMIRYEAQGDGTDVPQPIIVLNDAAYNGDEFTADVDFRVVWPGYGYEDADVLVRWGYSADSLAHTTPVASGVIGTGSGQVPMIADQRWVYLQAVATNAAGQVGSSSSILSIYVEQNDNAREDDTTPALADIGIRYDGTFAVITGVVASVGQSEETCSVKLRMGAGEETLADVVSADYAAGDVFALTNTGLSVSSTYYWQVVATADDNMSFATVAESFTTPGVGMFNTVTATRNQRTMTISGNLSDVGAGVAKVLVSWDYGRTWDELASFDASSESTSFSTTHLYPSFGANVQWQIKIVNTLIGVDGEPTGDTLSTTPNELAGTLANVYVADDATYTWQAVDGEWNGNWEDSDHWSVDKADNLGYPQTATATASFLGCTAENPVVVNVGGKYTMARIDFMGNNTAVDLTFVGNGAESSSLKASAVTTADDWKDKPAAKPASNTSMTFRDLAFDFGGRWEIARSWNITTENNSSITNMTLVLDAVQGKVAKWFCLATPYSRLELLNDTALSTGKCAFGGTNTVVLVDDSTLDNTAESIWVAQDGYGDMELRLRGKHPRILTSGKFASHSNTNNATIVFEVPVGGYKAVPIQMKAGNANKFGTPNAAMDPPYQMSFAVAEDSPALVRSDAALSDQVLVQTQNGFAMDYIAEGIGTVPEHKGESCGAFKWGLNDAALEGEEPDLTTARQLLLDLKGYGKGVLFLVF